MEGKKIIHTSTLLHGSVCARNKKMALVQLLQLSGKVTGRTKTRSSVTSFPRKLQLAANFCIVIARMGKFEASLKWENQAFNFFFLDICHSLRYWAKILSQTGSENQCLKKHPYWFFPLLIIIKSIQTHRCQNYLIENTSQFLYEFFLIFITHDCFSFSPSLLVHTYTMVILTWCAFLMTPFSRALLHSFLQLQATF